MKLIFFGPKTYPRFALPVTDLIDVTPLVFYTDVVIFACCVPKKDG